MAYLRPRAGQESAQAVSLRTRRVAAATATTRGGVAFPPGPGVSRAWAGPRRTEDVDEALFHDALFELLTGDRLPRPKAGRPANNVYLAAEIAYMWDIERKPLLDPSGESIHGYFESRYAPQDFCGTVLERKDARGPRSITRWRDRGRRVLASLDAWPWALVPEGRLPRTWWRDERFAAELAAWTRGERP